MASEDLPEPNYPPWYTPGPQPCQATVDLEDLGYGTIVIQDTSKPKWTMLANAKDPDSLRVQTQSISFFVKDVGDSGKFPDPGPGADVKAWEKWVNETPMVVYMRIQRATLICAGLDDPFEKAGAKKE
jgi:hypothetical protein